jgi:hypothetical protein
VDNTESCAGHREGQVFLAVLRLGALSPASKCGYYNVNSSMCLRQARRCIKRHGRTRTGTLAHTRKVMRTLTRSRTRIVYPHADAQRSTHVRTLPHKRHAQHTTNVRTARHSRHSTPQQAQHATARAARAAGTAGAAGTACAQHATAGTAHK